MATAPIYLDYHATTPVQQEVLDAMLPYFNSQFGNPSSRSHPFGWNALEAVEQSKMTLHELLGAKNGELIFTSGATESLNFLIRHFAKKFASKGKHIISAQTEHPASKDSIQSLETDGFEISWVPVEKSGKISIESIKELVRKDTVLISIMAVNNETGVVQEVDQIGKLCRDENIFFVSDFTQVIGKLEVPLSLDHVDAIAFSAHKFYGPKGIGVAWFHERWKRWKPEPIFYGGGHQEGWRSGTLPVHQIVGMAKAASLRLQNVNDEIEHLKGLQNEFEKIILERIPEVKINGADAQRVPSVTNFQVRFTEAQSVISDIRTKVAISTGSACSSANPEPSPVLLAMGLTPAQAKSSFRVSFGLPTTLVEITEAADLLINAIEKYRDRDPVWQMFLNGVNLDEEETI